MRHAFLFVTAVVVSVVAASPVFAQSTRRPDLNLFGRGLRDPRQQLAISANLGATFYDTISGQIAPLGGPAPPDHGWGSFASTALTYNLKLANLSVNGSVRSIASYYPALAKPFRMKTLPGAGADIGWSWAWELSPRTQLGVSSGVGYRALSLEAALPGGGANDAIAGGAVFGGDRQVVTDPTLAFLPGTLQSSAGSYLSAVSNVSLRHQFSPRWSLSGDYSVRRYFSFRVANDQLGTWGQGAGSAVHFAVTRNLSIRGGYRYAESHSRNSDRPFRSSGADVGIDYGRGVLLQLTRRTTLTMRGGAGAYVDQAAHQRYRVNGNAQLRHVMGRTWSSAVTYARDLDSSRLLFQGPVLSDMVSGLLDGLVSRRLGFHGSGSWQRGSVGFVGTGQGINRVMANAGVQTSLGRHLAVGLDYSYYRFRFESLVVLPAGLPHFSSSQGVSVYLSTWAPIFQRGGRSNASR